MKKDGVVIWKQFVRHHVGYYCINMKHWAHSERPCKIWCFSTEGSRLTRGREEDRLNAVDPGTTEPTPRTSCWQCHSCSIEGGGPLCLSEQRHSSSGEGVWCGWCCPLYISKGGSINAKEGVSILLRDFREAFPLGKGDGQELRFKHLLGVN